MPSMSYCALQNARDDLQQGVDRITDDGWEALSADEQQAAHDIIQLAQELHREMPEED